jgi:hypothetical protein
MEDTKMDCGVEWIQPEHPTKGRWLLDQFSNEQFLQENSAPAWS